MVHPTASIVLTGSNDMTIKAWDWDKGWKNIQVYKGHTHYIMNLTFNPKDGKFTLFNRTYAPSQAPNTVQASELTSKSRTKIAAIIADPYSNPELFEEGWEEVLVVLFYQTAFFRGRHGALTGKRRLLAFGVLALHLHLYEANIYAQKLFVLMSHS
ncbi:hypothetical protein BYT27DRAFT_7240885 [Phlegmacium glaucopus]|nr:hypothetical protein BYT27DRAFT_7240885 [Phlegmacium glaucopus]